MAGDSNMQVITFVLAFVVVLALIGVTAWLVRRFAGNRLGANANRGRMPRLAVIDAAAVDGRRRLVLVRRDNIEHLLMIGGPTDIVVEPNIVRAMPARDQMSTRPAVAADAAPPRVAPLPDAAWNESEAARSENFELPEPELPPRQARPLLRRRAAPAPAAARRASQRSARGLHARTRRAAARSDAATPAAALRAGGPAPAARRRAAEGAATAAHNRARRDAAATASPDTAAGRDAGAFGSAASIERRRQSRRDGATARSGAAPPDRRRRDRRAAGCA
ncbi:flagellar protein FliO/FliZ [Bradyrhizobium elkanii]